MTQTVLFSAAPVSYWVSDSGRFVYREANTAPGLCLWSKSKGWVPLDDQPELVKDFWDERFAQRMDLYSPEEVEAVAPGCTKVGVAA